MTGLVATLAVILLLAAAQAQPFHGKFGNDDLPLHFEFGNDTMLTTIGAPANGRPGFLPTSNLHIFSRKLVAIKTDELQHCYIQPFDEEMSELKARVMDAQASNGEIGTVIEESISIEGLVPLHPSHYILLGPKFIAHCGQYTVYVLKDVKEYPFKPQDKRHKRAQHWLEVARAC